MSVILEKLLGVPMESFIEHFLSVFFVGARPTPRLTPDAFEASSDWWVSSRGFFDARIREPPRIPSPMNLYSRDDPPVDIYRRMKEQDRVMQELKEKNAAHEEMYNKMKKFMEGNSPPSLEGPKQLLLMISICLPVDPRGQYGSSHIRDVGGVIPDAMNWERRVVFPSMYFQSPYKNFPDTTIAPKRRLDKSKNMERNVKVPPFDLGNAVVDDNLVDHEVAITGARDTDECIWYTNVDPNKVRREPYEEAMELFWRELVPVLYMSGYYNLDEPEKAGWLSDDQINCWMELVIRNRKHGARFIVAKSGTASQHPGSQQFIIETDQHIKGTLDGSTRPYPSWDDVDWVYMTINAGGNHWVTATINLPYSIIFILNSLHSDHRMSSLYHQLTEWTKKVNGILEYHGQFARTRQQPYNFQYFYNQGFHFKTPQQANLSYCGVVTCWLIYKLSDGQDPVVVGDTQRFFDNVRSKILYQFYSCRCQDTSNCEYD
ncbi:phospholipase-like protein [Tanacetum coccineum]